MDDSEDESTNKPQNKQQFLDLKNPLLTDLDFRDKETKRMHKAALWFEKDVFKTLENEDDADYELDKMIEQYKKKGGHMFGEEKIQEKVDEEKKQKRRISDDTDKSDDTDSDYDVEEMMVPNKKMKKVGGKDGFEIVPQETGKEVFIWLYILLIEIINY